MAEQSLRLSPCCTIPIPKNSEPPRAGTIGADCGGIARAHGLRRCGGDSKIRIFSRRPAVIGVLLYLKIITAEAGLPILAGIAGFALGNNSGGGSQSGPPAAGPQG
jgi:hypothetical protein